MAKFCTKCGKKLEDGKKCDCSKPIKDAVISETNKTKIDFQGYFDTFVDIAKGIFLKPIDTVKKYATEEHFIFSVIAIFLNTIVSGIMVYFLLEESMGLVTNLFGISSYGYTSMGMSSGMEISFFKVLLYAVLFMAAGFFGSAGMIHVMAGTVFKAKSTIKKAVSLVGTCSVLTTVTSVVAILCVFISMKLFAIVVMLSSVLYLCHLYHGIQIVSEVDENKQGYTFLATVAVVVLLVTYVLPKILF